MVPIYSPCSDAGAGHQGQLVLQVVGRVDGKQTTLPTSPRWVVLMRLVAMQSREIALMLR